jgi:hypothetical protein
MAAQTYDAVIGLAVCIVAAGILPEASFYNFLAFVNRVDASGLSETSRNSPQFNDEGSIMMGIDSLRLTDFTAAGRDQPGAVLELSVLCLIHFRVEAGLHRWK